MSITILAIESSCDETSAAVCVDGNILSNQIATQKVHEQYGGVVPELASRAHIQNIVPVVDVALSTANVQLASVDASCVYTITRFNWKLAGRCAVCKVVIIGVE